MKMDDSLCDFFEDNEFSDANNLAIGEDLFSILESLDGHHHHHHHDGSANNLLDYFPPSDHTLPLGQGITFSFKESREETARLVSHRSTSSSTFQDLEAAQLESNSPKTKRLKLISCTNSEEANPDGQQKISHITVERNRRRQMNDNLSVLRSLMPCFYVKRGDQASIIGGVVDYINELQQVLQTLEAKKQRMKVYSEVLSPRVVVSSSSPRVPSPLISPRKPPLSPRLSSVPISPRTPQPSSPYKPRLQQLGYLSPTSQLASPSSSATNSNSNINYDNIVNELFANSKSSIADVEVKFSGSNVLLKTLSPRIPGQAVKIISAIEDLSLEILQVSINTVDETMLNSFTIKIGIECQLSAEELALQIQQTFS